MAQIIALLPLGAYEYHGQHLPYETDSLIAEAYCRDLPPSSLFALELLASEKIGYSIEHSAKAQTKSLSFNEAIERWIAIGEKCYKNNIRKILFFNAHGGNSPLLNIVITELRVRYKMLAVASSWRRLGLPQDLPILLRQIDRQPKQPGAISRQQQLAELLAYDIHGGLLETSLMLAIAPHKVIIDKLADFPNREREFKQNYQHLTAYSGSNFGWMMQDLNPLGACGNAAGASCDIGQKLLSHGKSQLLLLLEDMARFPLADFR